MTFQPAPRSAAEHTYGNVSEKLLSAGASNACTAKSEHLGTYGYSEDGDRLGRHPHCPDRRSPHRRRTASTRR